jgi:beta-galactosidase
MDSKKFAVIFPLGSHLCREPMPPMPELKRDMEFLKKHGFNLVKLQEHWMIDEPLERQVDLSKYEELIEHAQKLDMGVYLGLTCEQAPGWLYEKHPECRMVGRDGRTIVYEAQTTLPADGKPGPCYDHPGAMADQLRFIRLLVERLGRYENLVVWNTWQEVGYWANTLAGQPVCFCDHTLEAFRRWLAEKYNDLDGLNRAWKARYGDWRFVQPDRGAYQQNALPSDIDWRYFMDNVQVARILEARAETITAYDPLKRPVFAHKGGMALGYAQDWTYAACQDFLGSSCYPAWSPFHKWDDGAPAKVGRAERHRSLLHEMWQGVALTYDQVRSVNRPGAPLWAAEFQGGPVSTFIHKGRVPAPADIRRWMLTAVSCGVNAISFWVTRAEIMAQEMNGFSLLDSEGEGTPRLEEAARIRAALNRHADLFAVPGGIGAEAAILVSEANAQFCSTCPPAGDHLYYSTRGWHRLLWEAGVPADFLDIEQVSAQATRSYRLLILLFPLSLSEQAASRLAHYVSAGGCLVIEAVPGRINEHGIANRGEISPMIRSLFGVDQSDLRMVAEPGEGQRWMPAERTWGEFLDPCFLEGAGPLAGERVRASLYLQTFRIQAGRQTEAISMSGGEIAGVRVTEGKGSAWLLGTCVGHSATAYMEPGTQNWLQALLRACGVETGGSGGLLVRRRSILGKEAVFLTNPTEQAITFTLPIHGYEVEDLLGEAVHCTDGKATLSVESLDVRVLVLTSGSTS